jgi:hypothetical protein
MRTPHPICRTLTGKSSRSGRPYVKLSTLSAGQEANNNNNNADAWLIGNSAADECITQTMEQTATGSNWPQSQQQVGHQVRRASDDELREFIGFHIFFQWLRHTDPQRAVCSRKPVKPEWRTDFRIGQISDYAQHTRMHLVDRSHYMVCWYVDTWTLQLHEQIKFDSWFIKTNHFEYGLESNESVRRTLETIIECVLQRATKNGTQQTTNQTQHVHSLQSSKSQVNRTQAGTSWNQPGLAE